MTDLVKILRGCDDPMMKAAADEIERLQKVNHALRHPYDAQKALIEDMREWGRESTIYDERTWSDHLDDYAKDRGIKSERMERSPERESKHWLPRRESWWSRHWRRNESL